MIFVRFAIIAALIVATEDFVARAAESVTQLDATPTAEIAPDCVRDGLKVQRQPAVAFGKAVYLVVWCDGGRQIDNPTADIYCARVEASTGKTLDPRGIRICAAPDLQEHATVAFDGQNFLVVWQDLRNGKDYDTFAARVTEQGKVLDPDGFPIIQRAGNQARPAVGFAGGNFLVVWMDARQYPVYGLYGTRVSVDGKVLDPDGKVLDSETPEAIAKVTPPDKSWLGDRHYWWNGLSSRFHPAVASDGNSCLVTYLREVHSNDTRGYALLVNPAELTVVRTSVKLTGQPRDRLSACAIPDGWVVSFDHWVSGWSPTPRLTTLRLDPNLQPRDLVPDRPDTKLALPAAPLLDLQKTLAEGGGDYQQGKGHFCFWQAATAWDGKYAVVAMDYGWRTKQKPNELHFAVVISRLDPRKGQFLDDPPAVMATGDSATETSVHNPVLAAGMQSEVLLVYENDTAIDSQVVEARLLRGRKE